VFDPLTVTLPDGIISANEVHETDRANYQHGCRSPLPKGESGDSSSQDMEAVLTCDTLSIVLIASHTKVKTCSGSIPLIEVCQVRIMQNGSEFLF
jgi:hypothetical protein